MSFINFIKRNPAVTCFAAGIIYSVQFWSDYTFIFAIPGLALYFFALFSCERKAFFRHSYAFFLGFFLPLYYWFIALYPLDGFGFTKGQAAAVVIVACIGIPIYHSLLMSGVMWLLKFSPQNKLLRPIYFAALWTAGEWVLSLGELSFSWGRTAIGQASFLPMVETASLFGSYFIAFVVAAASAYIATWFMEWDKKSVCIGMAILMVNITCGTVILFSQPKTENENKIAIIQGCVTSEDKWRPDYYGYIEETYYSMCEEAADNGAKLIFLPESPLPRYSTVEGERLNRFKDLAREKNVTILTGALIFDETENGTEFYNSIVAVLPDGTLSERYDKRHPVPFGEFIPYGELITSIVPALGGLNLSQDLTAGDTATVIATDGYTFVPLVCFDSIFASFSREGVKNGGNIIYVATNDSWYKSSRGVYEHMNFSVLRAIETGKPVIRSANTGISCIIDARGNVLAETEPMVQTTLYGTASLSNATTLYTHIGDLWLYLCFVCIATLGGYGILKNRKAGKQNEN